MRRYSGSYRWSFGPRARQTSSSGLLIRIVTSAALVLEPMQHRVHAAVELDVGVVLAPAPEAELVLVVVLTRAVVVSLEHLRSERRPRSASRQRSPVWRIARVSGPDWRSVRASQHTYETRQELGRRLLLGEVPLGARQAQEIAGPRQADEEQALLLVLARDEILLFDQPIRRRAHRRAVRTRASPSTAIRRRSRTRVR